MFVCVYVCVCLSLCSNYRRKINIETSKVWWLLHTSLHWNTWVCLTYRHPTPGTPAAHGTHRTGDAGPAGWHRWGTTGWVMALRHSVVWRLYSILVSLIVCVVSLFKKTCRILPVVNLKTWKKLIHSSLFIIIFIFLHTYIIIITFIIFSFFIVFFFFLHFTLQQNYINISIHVFFP